MPDYQYEIVDSTGQVVKGHAQAMSIAELVRELTADGHTVLEVKELNAVRQPLFPRRLRPLDCMMALHELTVLLESGVALGNAVQAQANGARHPALVSAFEAMGRALMRGENFLNALRAGRLVLPDYVYHLAEAGELSGHLSQALRRAVNQMQYDQKVVSEMRNALIYPSVLIVFGCTAVLLVFVLVIPQFSGLLETARRLPFQAEAVLRTGLWINANGFLIAIACAVIAVTIVMFSRRNGVRRRLWDALSTLPLLGDWLAETDTARWASLMGAMLISRVSLLDALGLATRSVRSSRQKARLELAAGDVRAGDSLSAALERHNALTPAGYNLLRVGEQSGQLAGMLQALAALCDENSRRRMKRFLVLVEPLAIVLVGGFLGFIMISIILAITSVNDVVF